MIIKKRHLKKERVTNMSYITYRIESGISKVAREGPTLLKLQVRSLCSFGNGYSISVSAKNRTFHFLCVSNTKTKRLINTS